MQRDVRRKAVPGASVHGTGCQRASPVGTVTRQHRELVSEHAHLGRQRASSLLCIFESRVGLVHLGAALEAALVASLLDVERLLEVVGPGCGDPFLFDRGMERGIRTRDRCRQQHSGLRQFGALRIGLAHGLLQRSAILAPEVQVVLKLHRVQYDITEGLSGIAGLDAVCRIVLLGHLDARSRQR